MEDAETDILSPRAKEHRPPPLPTTIQILRFIFNQPDLDLKNPDHRKDVIKKLKEDQQKIRQNYGLPPLELLRDDPQEFERRLHEITDKIGVTILPTSEFGSFFEENLLAGAVYFDEKSAIGVNIQRNSTKEDFVKSLLTLEHEVVHAINNKRYNKMPIELDEYIAYVANMNISYLEETIKDPENLKMILDFFLGGSVRNYYRRTEKTPPYINQLSKEKVE